MRASDRARSSVADGRAAVAEIALPRPDIAILPVRKIISGRNNGRVPTLSPDDGIGDISVCGTVPLTTITVQFLYFPPGNPATASQVAPINLSANTIAVHRANIMNSLGIHKTAELVVYAIRAGLVNVP